MTPTAEGTLHRHGTHLHSHPSVRAHRHLLHPRLSSPIEHAHPHHRGHSHGLVHESIKRSREGVRAVALALLVLAVTAAAQAVVFVATGSVALLADLIHNAGDASTAIPLGIAFGLRSARAERWAGLAVVVAIFASACVAAYEAVDRLIEPRDVEHLGALALAGGIGFAGNWAAAIIPRTGGAQARQPRPDRRRRPRARRRLRVARGRRVGGGRGARSSGGRPADRTGDQRRHPADHIALVADRPC
jgi:hypothetical protein